MLEDLKALFATFSSIFAAKMPGIRRRKDISRALRDIAYAGGVGLLFAVAVPLLRHMPKLKTAATYAAFAVSVVFLYDAGRILYAYLREIADMLAEKIMEEIER